MVKTKTGYKLLIGGGASLKFGRTGKPIQSAHLFDPKTGKWTSARDLPVALMDMSSVQYGDRMLFVGGATTGKTTR